MAQVLFQQRRFRQEPVEWVYDGLAPAMLPDVVTSGKGITLMMAIVFACVAQRLGVPVALRRVSDPTSPTGALGEVGGGGLLVCGNGAAGAGVAAVGGQSPRW
jgi:Transglutaminase-like superfamily